MFNPRILRGFCWFDAMVNNNDGGDDHAIPHTEEIVTFGKLIWEKSGKLIYPCPDCKEFFETRDDVKEHGRVKHRLEGEEYIHCINCGKWVKCVDYSKHFMKLCKKTFVEIDAKEKDLALHKVPGKNGWYGEKEEKETLIAE